MRPVQVLYAEPLWDAQMPRQNVSLTSQIEREPPPRRVFPPFSASRDVPRMAPILKSSPASTRERKCLKSGSTCVTDDEQGERVMSQVSAFQAMGAVGVFPIHVGSMQKREQSLPAWNRTKWENVTAKRSLKREGNYPHESCHL
jgi:hypothetical protein